MTSTGDLSRRLGDALDERAESLTRRWVERLVERLDVDGRDALPSDSLLNHIPTILSHIAEYVRDPDSEILEEVVVEDLRTLADLRREQGFGVAEVVEEFEILSAMIQDELEDVAAELEADGEVAEAVRTVGRLHRGLDLLRTTTTKLYRERDRSTRETRARFMGEINRILVHEMKNRLGSGESAARVLADPPEEFGEDDRARLFRTIVRSVEASLQALDDVSRLAALQGEGTRGEQELTPLRPVIEETFRDLEGDAAASGVDLVLEGEVPRIAVDRALVRLILANLVGNGIRYADDDEDERWVRVRVERHDPTGHWEIQVEDNGVGIPPDLHETIFEAFDRGGRSDGEGVGLGLSIVREAVDQMDGTIRVESEPDAGSLFGFTLPSGAVGESEERGA